MATIELSADNSIYVQITLTNALTAAFINDATVTGQIDNFDGTEAVASFSMPYVAASDGIYRATLAPDVDIVNGKRYTVIIDSTGTDSLIGHWECSAVATKASGCS
jgi:hypothetical protein